MGNPEAVVLLVLRWGGLGAQGGSGGIISSSGSKEKGGKMFLWSMLLLILSYLISLLYPRFSPRVLAGMPRGC